MDAILVHDTHGQELVERTFDVQGRTTVMPHPLYDVDTDAALDASIISELGIPEGMNVALCFGGVRRYKRQDRIVAIAQQLNQAGYCPVIAGVCPEPDYEAELRASTTGECRYLLRRLDESELDALLQGAGVILMPYGEALTSGAAHMVASHGRPMVTSAANAFRLFQDAGLSVTADFADSGSVLESIVAARKLEEATDWSNKVSKFTKPRGSHQVGESLRSIYAACLSDAVGTKDQRWTHSKGDR